MDTLRRTLHERGLRMTPQRQLVLDAVRHLGHATPEQVCGEVQRSAPAVNITTVYRTLDLLERLGLVRHVHLGHGAPTYSEHEHEHLHLVCHSCGELHEASMSLLAELAARLRESTGFRLDAAHVALSGLCARCAAERPATVGHTPQQGHEPQRDQAQRDHEQRDHEQRDQAPDRARAPEPDEEPTR